MSTPHTKALWGTLMLVRQTQTQWGTLMLVRPTQTPWGTLMLVRHTQTPWGTLMLADPGRSSKEVEELLGREVFAHIFYSMQNYPIVFYSAVWGVGGGGGGTGGCRGISKMGSQPKRHAPASGCA